MHRLILIAICIVLTARGDAAQLLAGPMVGHTTDTTSTIWVETDEPAQVRVEYWMQGWFQHLHLDSAEGRTSDTVPHTAAISLPGLSPGAQVHYELFIDGRSTQPLSPQVFYTMPGVVPPADHPEYVAEFTVAFGSCLDPARQPVQSIWAQVAKFRPAAFLYIGDIHYLPQRRWMYGSDRGLVRFAISRFHREVRHQPGIRTLMATTPSYGIWDDHDYGPDDSDRTFPWRKESLEIYNRFWPNAGAGTQETPGVFFKFRIEDVEFFMLDNRYHRDPNLADNPRTMLGSGQLSWLKAALQSSNAIFKIIAAGGSSVTEGRGERWAHFGSERDDFLEWIFDEKINGVLFICGDWHVGVLNRLYRPQDAYPLYELVSSNAGVRVGPTEPSLTHGRSHHRAASQVYSGYNFGALHFSGDKGKRTVSLQIIDQEGVVQIHRRLNELDLKPEE